MEKIFILIFTFVMGTFLSSCNSGNNDSKSVQDAIIENIMTRHSVRSYTSEPVSEEMIETMLRAGMAAPSAMNRQPWELVVVTDRELLDAMAGKLKYAKMLVEAPLAIVVCAKTHFINRDGENVENMFWEHDASAVTENILLAAHALGLGAVWTAASDPVRSAAVRETLGIPCEITPLCVIPIGHPKGESEIKDKWKPEKIHYNKW